MQKIILVLIVIFGLLGCKNPIKEAEDMKDKLDIYQDSNSVVQSAHYKSENLGLEIEINHNKSVAHRSTNLNAEHLNF